jgi:hypothetical protein
MSLKELVSWLKRGKEVPFLREISPPKNVPLLDPMDEAIA